jgi:hypothetical protein
MGLAAVAAHKLGGLIPIGLLFTASMKIGALRSRQSPRPPTIGPQLRVLP